MISRILSNSTMDRPTIPVVRLQTNDTPVSASLSVRASVVCTEVAAEQMHTIRSDWNDLFQKVGCATTFSTWEWTSVWWKYFHDKLPEGRGRLVVVTAWSGSTLIGVAPFAHPERLWYGMRRLRSIGDVETLEGMTEEAPMLLRPGFETEALDGICNYLRMANGRHRWDCALLRLTQSTIPHVRINDSPRDFEKVVSMPQTVDLPKTWAEYYSTLSRSMKTNLSYYPRRIQKQGHTWSFRVAKTPEEVRDALPQLIQLHGSRAQSVRGVKHNNHIPTQTHADFLTEILVSLAQENKAWIGLIELDDKVIAAQAFLETHNSLQFYYSGFDVAYYDYSPLLLLAAESIKYSMGRGITRLDFLPDHLVWDGEISRLQEYKTRWGAQSSGTISERAIFSTHTRATCIKGIRYIREKLMRFGGATGLRSIHFGLHESLLP
jgi:CelD/BcsL family acetyltransferase involved in cellulose biosynthesis